MTNKSDELDYITDVMRIKKEDSKNKKTNSDLNVNIINRYYKIGPKKIHKNITLDEEIVNWVNKEAKQYKLNFSETINQILLFSKENSVKKNDTNINIKNIDNKKNSL